MCICIVVLNWIFQCFFQNNCNNISCSIYLLLEIPKLNTTLTFYRIKEALNISTMIISSDLASSTDSIFGTSAWKVICFRSMLTTSQRKFFQFYYWPMSKTFTVISYLKFWSIYLYVKPSWIHWQLSWPRQPCIFGCWQGALIRANC